MRDYSVNPLQRTCVSNTYFWKDILSCPWGMKVLLLTDGYTCVVGHADEPEGYIGWAPLPRRALVEEL